MKKITVSDGNVIIAYDFADLQGDAKDRAIGEHIEFLIEVADEDSFIWPAIEKAEKLQTPWFTGSIIWEMFEREIIEHIEINEYLFNEDGDLLPITRHWKDNKPYKYTFGRKQKECKIEKI